LVLIQIFAFGKNFRYAETVRRNGLLQNKGD